MNLNIPNSFSEAEQLANVAKVRGTVVTLRAYLGKPRPKLARIRNYIAPCVWELDEEIGNPRNRFHPDVDVCLPNGERVGSLIPNKPVH